MNVALRKPMTLTEFLAWEENEEARYEFDGSRVVDMAGGSAAHARIQRNLAVAIQSRLSHGPCEFFGADLRFLTAEDTVRYPDGMVICERVEDDAKFARNPKVVFEVLSPSTTETDRSAKVREYGATASVQRYVMLEQTSATVVVYPRAGGAWTPEELSAGGLLALPEIGLEFPLAELYVGVRFKRGEASG